MNRYIPWIALALLAAGPAIPDEPGFRVVVPAETTLRLAGPDVPQSSSQWSIGFEGQISIHAKYHFVYEQDGAAEARLLLVPDRDSLDRLPHVTRPGTGWEPEKAEVIEVTNIREAAKALLSEELSARVFAGELRDVEGEARFVVDEFEAGYLCDAPEFTVRMVKVERDVLQARIGTSGPSSGC